MLCVATLIEGVAGRRVQKLWRTLEDKLGINGVLVTPFAHFSWQLAWRCDPKKIAERLAALAASLEPFPAAAAGLAMFLNEHPVIYSPVVRSAELSRIHGLLCGVLSDCCDEVNARYTDGRWLPHITLAQGDVEPARLPEIVGLLASAKLDFEFRVDNLVLVEEAGGGLHVVTHRFDFPKPSRRKSKAACIPSGPMPTIQVDNALGLPLADKGESAAVKLPGNMQNMMKQAQQMQQRLQEEIAQIRVEASAGGGMVTIRMDGHKNVLSCQIDPEVAGDVEMIQDMVVAACNEAVKKVDEASQQKMGGMLSGLGLPPGMF